MSTTRSCPALFLCSPSSRQGKTTITAGIARYHSKKGKNVRIFKTGPDYLDPFILEQASGNPVYNLDLWMVGKKSCKKLLFEAAMEADLILIEGVMGMFDGKPSCADMAQYFGVPIAIVIDARSMAQSFGAIAYGLATYQPSITVMGVIANSIGSQNHIQLITHSMPNGINLLGWIKHIPTMSIPERHLGLVQPHEINDIDQRINHIAHVVSQSDLKKIPKQIPFYDIDIKSKPTLLRGLRIGIAKDKAFNFIYIENLALLKDMGAICTYFSPINDRKLPDVDAVWFPGGYPELHHKRLSANISMKIQLKIFHKKGFPILAECGGMIYLMNSLTDISGVKYDMMGLLPGDALMQERGGCQGMQCAVFPEGEIRAHAHHRTQCKNTLRPVAYGKRLYHVTPGEPIYQINRLSASYLHLYFPSNPIAVAKLLSRDFTNP